MTEAAGDDTRFATRIGLALAAPEAAFALAGDRRNTGRAGTDLLLLIAMLVVATQARALVGAAWLGVAVDAALGLRLVVNLLVGSLSLELGLLAVGAVVVFAAMGPRRAAGRAFDLACVAVIPVIAVELVARVIGLAVRLPAPLVAGVWILAVGWMGALLLVAAISARRGAVEAPGQVALARGARGGLALAGIAGIGLVVGIADVVRDTASVRPLVAGAEAPPFALPAIGPGGALGEPVSRAPGAITVLDFWATWCGPCLQSLPHLDEFARRHPEVKVLAVDIDDPAAARTLFDERHFTVPLVAGDDAIQARFGVTTIPHTVVIDRAGHVLTVARGGGLDLEAELRAIEK